MSLHHDDFVKCIEADDPQFANERAAARASLDISLFIERRRAELGQSLNKLALASGVAAARIAVIEEGETPEVIELLLICRALSASISIDDRLSVAVTATHSMTGTPVA